MDTFKITLVQTDLFWENREKNFQKISAAVRDIDHTDLILLPEMFSSGFSMSPEKNYEVEPGIGLQWMQDLSAIKNCAVCGSIIVREGDKYYNRLYFVSENGNFETYDKKHLFTLAGEEKVYTAGQKKLITEYRGWKILPFVCYDLRFPVWCRNTEEADLMLFVANWPERRAEAWKTLLKARAIENMCYVAGVNRVGKDGNGIDHSGDSALYDELGGLQSDFKPFTEAVCTYELQKKKIYDSRKKFSFLKDRDSFQIL